MAKTRTLFALCLLPFVGWALPTPQTIDEFPRSHAKDFYLWSYMQETNSSQRIDALFAQSSLVTLKYYQTYLKISPHEADKEVERCMQLDSASLLDENNPSCITLALTPYKASLLSSKERARLWKRIDKHPAFDWMPLLDHISDARSVQKEPEKFLRLFLEGGSATRQRLNHHYDAAFYHKLEPLKEFHKFVERAIIDTKMVKIHRELLFFQPRTTLSTQARFYLALNKIAYGHFARAKEDLHAIAKQDYLQSNRDKATFWLYLLTNEKNFLERLTHSTDINIYSIYAAQKLKEPLLGIYAPQFDEERIPKVIESDPFVWGKMMRTNKQSSTQEICEMLVDYDSPLSQSIYAFLLERCGKYTIHPYVMPFDEHIQSDDPLEKALLYAIGRQESRLISGGLSSVFAQGAMQIMPFLSKAIAKERHETIDESTMFDPKYNISYALQHIRFLDKRLSHPLHIAYAYNGGIGYLKGEFARGLFQKKGRFEPYMSMERLTYGETREYGKKVLANYIVYAQLLGKELVIEELFDTLVP